MFENSRRYSQLKVHHRCRWHRWQMEKSSIIEVLIILFGHLWEVEVTYRYNFAFKFTLRSQQPDIVPIICHRCHWRRYHWHRGQICHGYQQHQQNLPPVSLICPGVLDTGGKFATGVIDTGGALWLANISANFRTKFESVLMGYFGAAGNWFMKKPEAKKSRDIVPLNADFNYWWIAEGRAERLVSWLKKGW